MNIARIVDFETTGTPDDADAEVIEMARVDVHIPTKRFGRPWSSLCCPRGEIPAVAKAVHHITEDDVKTAPQARELWDRLFDGIVQTDYLVAHNAKFEKHFHAGDGRAWICTYKVSRIVWPDAPSHSNQALRYWLGLPVSREQANPAHRALPDCYVTALLFIELLKHKTPAEMVQITKYPALLKTMNFGKHKGTAFADAPADYLQWIADKSDMDEDTKFSARYWLKKRV